MLLALTALVAAAGFGFGLDQFMEKRQVVSAPLVKPAASAPQAFKLKTFDPSVWPRTDAEVGITGFRIEDFEDAELVEGLQIELSDSTTDNFGPTNKLPLVFNPDFNDTGGGRVFVPGVWDGSHVLINRRTPSPQGYADYVWGDTAFYVSGGASSFGFSLHEMDRDTELSVNGVPLVNLRKLLPSGTTRGGYVRIDAAPGHEIFSVKVANSVTDTTGEQRHRHNRRRFCVRPRRIQAAPALALAKSLMAFNEARSTHRSIFGRLNCSNHWLPRLC